MTQQKNEGLDVFFGLFGCMICLLLLALGGCEKKEKEVVYKEIQIHTEDYRLNNVKKVTVSKSNCLTVVTEESDKTIQIYIIDCETEPTIKADVPATEPMYVSLRGEKKQAEIIQTTKRLRSSKNVIVHVHSADDLKVD